MPTIPIADIIVQNRFRKDLRNLKSLMDSIKELGLLHPVVVNSDFRLVAGARRLEACQKLGWTHVPVRIVNLNDLTLRAEHDENVVREGFLPSEAVAIKKALEPIERAKAKQRILEGAKSGGRGNKKTRANLSRGFPTKTRERVALYTGMSHASLSKAEEIIEAAEREPEKYGDLAIDLDKKYRSLSWLYRKLKVRQQPKNSRILLLFFPKGSIPS